MKVDGLLRRPHGSLEVQNEHVESAFCPCQGDERQSEILDAYQKEEEVSILTHRHLLPVESYCQVLLFLLSYCPSQRRRGQKEDASRHDGVHGGLCKVLEKHCVVALFAQIPRHCGVTRDDGCDEDVEVGVDDNGCDDDHVPKDEHGVEEVVVVEGMESVEIVDGICDDVYVAHFPPDSSCLQVALQ